MKSKLHSKSFLYRHLAAAAPFAKRSTALTAAILSNAHSMLFLLAMIATSILTACATTQPKNNPNAAAMNTAGTTNAAASTNSASATNSAATQASTTPKYIATTIPLSKDHEYLARGKHNAPDFWALIGYYVPQEEHACSAASISMILNGFNSKKNLTSSDEIVRQKPLIEKVNSDAWKRAIESGHCLGLDALSSVIRESLKIYGYDKAKVEVTHISDATAATRKMVHDALVNNEKSDKDFILANFIQGYFTGDPEAMDAGHISLVGAYDANRKRVLILDVDRQYYEPYWVSEETFFKGLNTTDKGSKAFRGFARISVE